MSNSVKDKVLKLLGSVEGITIGPVGVSLSRSSGTSRFRVAEFPRILEALLREATNKYQAFLLIMDETERVSGIPHMASLLKDTLEHLQRTGFGNFTLVLTATPQCLDALTEDHPSFPRLFRYVNLKTMSNDECKELVSKALRAGRPPTKITDEVLDMVHYYSDGFPGLTQELGYSAFDANKDDIIDRDDFVNGVVGSGMNKGALDTIYDKHFRKVLTKDLLSDRYRQILDAVDEYGGGDFSFKDIKSKMEQDKKLDWQIGPYIGPLVQRNVLQRVPGQKGRYRFTSRMLPLWIRLKGIEQTKKR